MAQFRVGAMTITILITLLNYCRSQSGTTLENPVGTEHFLATDVLLAKDVAPDFTFAVWDQNNKICMLAKFAVLSFEIPYPSIGGKQYIFVNLPEDAKVRGLCGMLTKQFEREPRIELVWPGFRLTMFFTVVDLKRNENTWELSSMELWYDTSSPIFNGSTNVGKKLVRTLEKGLFLTPYGKSYFCPSPDVIPMYDSKNETVVLTRMKDVHLQVHDVQMGRFSQFSRCSSARLGLSELFIQNEFFVIIVGSMLAVALVMVVVLGYAVWKKLKQRKF